MSSRQCKLSPNSFCYVCGKFIITKKKRNFTEAIKRAYFQYFQIPVSNLDKKWVPGVVCDNCRSVLMNWAAGKNKYLTFGIPMQWREPTNHATDCYFCLTKTFGFNNKNKKHVQYPDVPSVTKPVLHSDGVPYPSLPSSSNSKNDSGSINLIEESSWKQCDLDNDDDDFMEDESKGEPHMITQSKLNDLMRDLQLSKAKSELLASRLQQWNLLAPNTRASVYRRRSDQFIQYYNSKDGYEYCQDVRDLWVSFIILKNGVCSLIPQN